jgi:hypothetical protein
MAALPTGTVTFLFTDIEGSTTLLQRLGDRRYAEVLAEHRLLLRETFAGRKRAGDRPPRGLLPGGFLPGQRCPRDCGGGAKGSHEARLA